MGWRARQRPPTPPGSSGTGLPAHPAQGRDPSRLISQGAGRGYSRLIPHRGQGPLACAYSKNSSRKLLFLLFFGFERCSSYLGCSGAERGGGASPGLVRGGPS